MMNSIGVLLCTAFHKYRTAKTKQGVKRKYNQKKEGLGFHRYTNLWKGQARSLHNFR